MKVDTEEALNRATDKFIGRFRKVEEEAARQGRALEGMSLAELDKLWEHAKET
ncbi:Nucleoside triphosphate pyrophosphohydrolase/pyrophosphatase MazG [Flavonifractor plautii]|uniref:Nucleoside triphosphate pyrophosphohydrolase/pyrophosphatase MazG n=1 Tax=Flavonifractor plautii TaxID=292800 RepID=A0A174L5P3_FLAPL|nr:Nucleoside triphosphate pyrophosphohydrolase/pyrophosphatase MazG [Flavonifractor plautii]